MDITPPVRFAQPVQATPPNSPTRRRRFLRDSDETDGEMTIEAFLYNADDFRTSSWHNPLPMPFKVDPPESRYDLRRPEYASLRLRIAGVLRDHEIADAERIFHCGTLSKPGYRDGHAPTPTLIIQTRLIEEKRRRRWRSARNILKDLLRDAGFPAMEVEIIDYENSFHPSLFALSPESPAIAAYERFRLAILKVLFDRLGNRWQAMSMFRFGTVAQRAKPSLVLFVKPGSLLDWRQLELDLLRMFPTQLGIKVEFLPGWCGSLADDDWLDKGSVHSDTNIETEDEAMSSLARLALTDKLPGKRLSIEGNPGMGSSIGIKGQSGGGTLGGFVMLTNSKSRASKLGFLTNHHVIYPDNLPDSTKTLPHQYGFGARVQLSPVEIESPAKDDTTHTTVKLNQSIATIRTSLANTKTQVGNHNMKTPGEPLPVKLRGTLDLQRESIRALKSDRDVVRRTWPKGLGRVAFSSGRHISPRVVVKQNDKEIEEGSLLLDWAFVQLDPKLSMSSFNNILPPSSHSSIRGHQPSDYDVEDNEYVVRDDHTSPRGLGIMEKGRWCFKLGRTSEITTGVCNGVEMDLNRTEELTFYDDNGRPIAPNVTATAPYVRTREFVVLAQTRAAQGNEVQDVQGAFCLPGDSGSFVFNSGREACGLMYGNFMGYVGRQTDRFDAGRLSCFMGLVTSMDMVKQHILKRTGGDMELI